MLLVSLQEIYSCQKLVQALLTAAEHLPDSTHNEVCMHAYSVASIMYEGTEQAQVGAPDFEKQW